MRTVKNPLAQNILDQMQSQYSMDPEQIIDVNDPVSRLIMAITLVNIEQGRSLYSYDQYIKGCATSAGIDPDVFDAEVTPPQALPVENSSAGGGYVSPASGGIAGGGSGFSLGSSGYIQLGDVGIGGGVSVGAGGVSAGVSITSGGSGFSGSIGIPTSSPPMQVGSGYIPLTQDAISRLPANLQNDAGFINSVNNLAYGTNASANDYIAVMQFESKLNPSIVNSIGATGLIQIIPSTAAGLGYTTAQIGSMSAAQQVAGPVTDYYNQVRLPANPTRADLYLATFYPAAVGKGSNNVIADVGSIVWEKNPSLRGPNNGPITNSSVAAAISRTNIPYANSNSTPAQVEGVNYSSDVTTGYTRVGTDANGNPVYADPNNQNNVIYKNDNGAWVTANPDGTGTEVLIDPPLPPTGRPVIDNTQQYSDYIGNQALTMEGEMTTSPEGGITFSNQPLNPVTSELATEQINTAVGTPELPPSLSSELTDPSATNAASDTGAAGAGGNTGAGAGTGTQGAGATETQGAGSRTAQSQSSQQSQPKGC